MLSRLGSRPVAKLTVKIFSDFDFNQARRYVTKTTESACQISNLCLMGFIRTDVQSQCTSVYVGSAQQNVICILPEGAELIPPNTAIIMTSESKQTRACAHCWFADCRVAPRPSASTARHCASWSDPTPARIPP